MPEVKGIQHTFPHRKAKTGRERPAIQLQLAAISRKKRGEIRHTVCFEIKDNKPSLFLKGAVYHALQHDRGGRLLLREAGLYRSGGQGGSEPILPQDARRGEKAAGQF